MTLRRPLTLNSYHFQTHNLGMARGAEVVVTPGLFYIDCGSGPLGAGRVIADGLNWHPQGCPFLENLPDGQIWMVVGSIDSHVDALGPCLYLAFCYILGNLLLTFLNSQGVCGKIGWFTNPSACPCKQECSIPGLTWTKALSQRSSPIKKTALPRPVTMALVRPVLA